MIITSDKKEFVTGVVRYQIPLALPRRKLRERIAEFRALNPTREDYALAHKKEDSLNLAFAASPGYPLAECAIEHFGPAENFLWCEALEDGRHLVVAVQGDQVVADDIVEADDDDLSLWATIFGENINYHAYVHGDVPYLLLDRLQSGQGIVEQHSLEVSALPDLPTPRRLKLKPISLALEETQGRSAGNSSAALFGVLGLLVLGAAIFYFQYGGEQTVARVLDRYDNYRQTVRGPSATSSLNEIYTILDGLSHHPTWKIDSCEYAPGTLVCEMAPLSVASAFDLNEMERLAGAPIDANLVGETAIIHITASPKARDTSSVITHTEITAKILRDNINTEFMPGTMKWMNTVDHGYWASQQIQLEKQGAEMLSLLIAAEAAYGLPSTLDSLKMNREGRTYTINMAISTHGSKG